MIVYAESSAVLSWLLAEPRGVEAARVLESADVIVASVLTGIECSRAIVRGVQLGALTRGDARVISEALARAELGWHRMEVSDRVMIRARIPFPAEPVRSLDAIHLASALVAHEAYRGVTMVSFDERIRANAEQLGMMVLPSEPRSSSPSAA
ncbi:MAG: type II toxin-antitoxin system VapC family toxin [Gemmatimonadaceae bacterium]